MPRNIGVDRVDLQPRGCRKLFGQGENRIFLGVQGVVDNRTGNPGLATGGSGDVLAGCTAAFAGAGLASWDASRLAVLVHGLAADRAADAHGQHGLLPGDVIAALGPVLAGVFGR